jgi:hypothetical protein
MDEDLSITEAMKKSAEQTKPYSWKIYEVIAIVFVIAMISIFGFFGALLSTILSLLYSLAIPLRYYEFKKVNKA